MSDSLSVSDLSVRFGGIHAVQGVRLDASVGPLVSRADRLRVLVGYYAAFATPRVRLSTMAAWIARRSASKRARTGVPR